MKLPLLGDVVLKNWVVNIAAGLIAIAVVFGTVGLAWANHQLIHEQITSANRHHDQTVRLQKEIITLLGEVSQAQQDHDVTLNQISALQKQVAAVIDGLPAADAYLGQLAVGLESQIQSLCNAAHATCSSLPVPLPPLSQGEK